MEEKTCWKLLRLSGDSVYFLKKKKCLKVKKVGECIDFYFFIFGGEAIIMDK